MRSWADAQPGAANGRTAGELLNEVAAGAFPPPDGSVTVLPQSSSRDTGVIGFTAHAIEVPPDQRGRGHGRELAGAARSLVPAGSRCGHRSRPATRPACGRSWRRACGRSWRRVLSRSGSKRSSSPPEPVPAEPGTHSPNPARARRGRDSRTPTPHPREPGSRKEPGLPRPTLHLPEPELPRPTLHLRNRSSREPVLRCISCLACHAW